VEFFDRSAPNYLRLRGRFFLRTLRAREEKSVMWLLDPRPGDEILDAGCGPGHYSRKIMALGARVYGVDASAEMVTQARAHGIEAGVADLHDMKLDQTFDKILCTGVLEFCHSPKAVLDGFLPHLRENGLIVVLVPRPSPMGCAYRLYHRSHGLSIHLFSVRQLGALAKPWLRIARLEFPTPMSLVARLERYAVRSDLRRSDRQTITPPR